ncbi:MULTISPECIES: Ni/Fe-hydrogenase, b-type cytochrome subunit [Acetobacter]|jgi:Ni/Fe-hydrogenase 1 B-type cytochrome subunit|uniref:Probable Ni/Fe-hydrogenase B-type cytochrome subunit n=1 Tax=Acetobacter lovaniensis TaxID=104100 RepID=A0A841QIT2_9PROT|nr:Ni/Fe-hydrogenase, b-type cytochrome subunit [Acetobacter lovaniensis]MBB6458235.1 Ni/Fe-hydrogenase 1 B-type cytochrome subunit [Acetobacter lovaniensis]MCI1795519.1 Ni/Fe-hydrogenase, b-type cytochrome subunit [Acetobacter lovaniensis]MCP1240481.1 Ni/Fe-hydrogenase, b-type cytochrome subunit [Acetobacter lovaniensis]NHN82480.1 Ni/Fe-hydrogenase, b-type cytochrome subunit [Acetobacter lovaniensis]GBQ70515.1 Ni,Fe-hydrogenase I cytochrome b subunit [Acetobacter lovaniensis NRIC 0474]
MVPSKSNILTDEDLQGTNLQGQNARALRARKLTTIYVYEAPVRLWHWVTVASIVVLVITGYFIGSPPPSLSGEASNHFLMGWIRYLHFSAAWIFAVGFAGRILWTFMGNIYTRELFYLPVWRRDYWKGLLDEILVYAFIKKQGEKTIGHNPLARTALFFCFTLTGLFMIVSGFALYSDGTGIDSWEGKVFGWVMPWLGGNLSTHFLHHWGMWVIILFVMIHVYTVTREDITSRQTLLSAMTNGYRSYKDDHPE